MADNMIPLFSVNQNLNIVQKSKEKNFFKPSRENFLPFVLDKKTSSWFECLFITSEDKKWANNKALWVIQANDSWKELKEADRHDFMDIMTWLPPSLFFEKEGYTTFEDGIKAGRLKKLLKQNFFTLAEPKTVRFSFLKF